MANSSLYKFEPLFIKPLIYPGSTLYSRRVVELNATISFRSMDMDKDLDMIFDWVNRRYALKYWQLDGPKERVYNTYYSIQRNSNGHSYIGLLDDKPVCQFDVYRVLADEIQQYITADDSDCGFHLLMSPNERAISGLSVHLVRAFLFYYFSFSEAKRMFAEPDIQNERSNRILQKLGFTFLHAIKMSYKTANLYCLTKEQFHETNH